MNDKIDINGFTNKVDVINSIVDNIDDGKLDNAKDMLFQLRTQEEVAEALNPFGKYKLVEEPKQMELPLEEPEVKPLDDLENALFGTKEESDVDTLLELENEMARGK